MADVGDESHQILRASNVDKENMMLEPCQKKIKLSDISTDFSTRLEERLSGILCCAVCLDLPLTCFQCPNGHLMCAGCLNHLLADARMRDETATCPNCRCDMTKANCMRNLAVEKAASEMPVDCHLCSQRLSRHQIYHHQRNICPERPTACRFACIGCRWKGPNQSLSDHENECGMPVKSGVDIMAALEPISAKQAEERQLYKNIFSLLSFEKITFHDLQLKPYRTDDFITQLFYESSRFSAFSMQWTVRITLGGDQKNFPQSSRRSLQYQLIMKTTKPANAVCVHFLILKGPFGDINLNPVIYQHDFNSQELDSGYKELPLSDCGECNRLLSMKFIGLRVILFQVITDGHA